MFSSSGNFLKWFSATVEGKDGKASYRRLWQHAFGVCIIIVGIRKNISEIEIKALIVFASLFLIILLSITGQQLIELFAELNKAKQIKDDIYINDEHSNQSD